MSAAIRVATRVIDQDDFDGSVLTDGYVVTYVASNGTFKLKAAAGGGSPTGAAGGDLTGTYPNPTLADGTVDTAELVAGAVTEAKQTLADNTTGNVSTSRHGYAPKAPNDATKFLDGTGAYTVPAGGGGTPSGSAGGDLGGTYPNPAVVKLQGSPVSSNLPSVGGALAWDGARWQSAVPGGDIGGTYAAALVQKLQGEPLDVSAVLPTQVLTWTGAVWSGAYVPDTTISISDNSANNVTIAQHGFVPKAPNDVTQFLDGTGLFSVPAYASISGTPSALPPNGSAGGDLTGTYPNPTLADGTVDTVELADGAVTEAKQTLADNTTWDVSIARHGYAPKAPNDATKFLDGLGAYSVPVAAGSAGGDLTGTYPNPTLANTVVDTAELVDGAVTEAKQTLADNTTWNANATQHGYVPKTPADASKYLDGSAIWSTPPAAGSAGGDLGGSYPNPTIATVTYTVANAGNWASPPPGELKNAVDRLAAWIAANGTVFTALGITTQP